MWWKKKVEPTYCLSCAGMLPGDLKCPNCLACEKCGTIHPFGAGCPKCAKPKLSSASAIALQLQNVMPSPRPATSGICPICFTQACGGTCLANNVSGQLTYAGLQRAYAAIIGLPITSSIEKLPIDLEKLSQLEKVEPRKVLARTPDLVEVITAYRVWAVMNGKLGGVGTSFSWQPKKKQVATCESGNFNPFNRAFGENTPPPHTAPAKDCCCGFWGFKTLDLLLKAANTHDYRNIVVLGKVSLWGRVIECEFGFRAEFAYPAEIWGVNLGVEATEGLGLAYGVPVRTL